MRHFENVGLYDGLFMMQDVESKTLWNHITGEALYGPHVGRSLGTVGNMLQMRVEQALVIDEDTQVAISGRPYSAAAMRRFAPDNPNARLMPMFTETLGTEDARLPRMAMGLGIVTDATVRFYPTELIEDRGAVIDEVDGRGVLVFIDPATFTPAALFVDTSSATLEDRVIRLDTGRVVRRGLLYDAGGTRVDAERPQQLFSRWYGFSLTFPGPEIFGQ